MVNGSLFETGLPGDGNVQSAGSEPESEPVDDRLKCHACGEVHSNARVVTVPDGRQFGNYSEEWRHYCEAKWVLKRKRTKRTRQEYLAKVEQLRGTMAAHYLREEMLIQWKHSQGQA